MEKHDFLKEFNKKQTSITAFNQYLRQGCEFEIATYNSQRQVLENLQRSGLGCASSGAINDGNGWNNDVHCDGGDCNVNGHEYYATETSTSPFHSTNFRAIKAEFDRIMPIYLQASGGLRHSYYSSTHTHTAIGYADFGNENIQVIDGLPTMKMYRNVAAFFVRFLPVFQWLSMTNIEGARGAAGNHYDCLDGDALYEWFFEVDHNKRVMNRGEYGHTEATDRAMVRMQRGSMLRIYNREIFHFENRMMDCNFSATMLAAWFCLNRAVALWAYDMARNGFQFHSTSNEIEQSKQVAAKHSVGWKHVPKAWIVENYTLMKSYLYKYFKLMNSVDALDVLDKLIDCPIPQFLEENNLGRNYDVTKIENHFAVRIREKDEELRNKYLEAIKTMIIPMAGNLNDFHLNVAAFLGVQQKQAVSLYQMFKRENVELEFLAGRLVYMGE
jgi:hypothetical protein